MPKHTEKTLKTETIFEGKVFAVTVDQVELENGSTATREVVHHKGGAAVVALDEAGNIVLVRQYRYAAGSELLELPAGKIEPGEPPAQTALRELGEEAGLTAARFEAFGRVLPTCAFCTEIIYLFLARELSPVPRHPDPDEFVDVLRVPLAQAVAMVEDGRIIDSKTVAGVLRAQRLVDAGG